MTMRQALPSSGRTKARPIRVPAPVGGWNTSDSLASMKPTDAVYLDNFFPRTSDVIMRKGRQLYASIPEGKHIRTVIGYKSPKALVKMFAAAEDGIYDVTGGGSVISPVSAATNAEWQYTPITTAGGSFLMLCNGVDNMKLYDGASWQNYSETVFPTITGLPPSEVANIHKYKTRVILCRKDSMSFWYLPINAIAGAATEYPLGAIFSEGGYLMATATWTIDGGNGPDDYFVAITSEGEVALYSGTDPASSTTFNLVGIFKLGKPMSRRCFVKLASDTAVITREAVYPLSKSLGVAEKDKRVALTAKIQRAYSEFANTYSALYGWSISMFSDESMLIVNVPILNYPGEDIMYSYQLVMNTMTGSWARFTGMNAECVTVFDGKFYSALKNKVTQNWVGTQDDNSLIVSSAKTAFSPLGSGTIKKLTMIKPLISASASVTLQLGVDVDYEQRAFSGGIASYAQELTRWDEAVWNVAKWNGAGIIISQWRSVACRMGVMVSVRLRCSSKDVTMTWIETGMLVEDGGLV